MKYEEVSHIEFSRRIDEILKRKKFHLFWKRLFDIIASFIGIIIMSIFMIIISVMIKASSKGPVFFKQLRVGKNGKKFKILKFRTMIPDAEKKGMQITVGDDVRITKVGKFLRKTKLDEFPQLFNVLKGDMSLVGPRPEVEKFVSYYDDYQKNVLKIKPGITDFASIKYRNESEVLGESSDPMKTYIEDIMPVKLEINLEYIENFSFFKDIGIIFKTLCKIVS